MGVEPVEVEGLLDLADVLARLGQEFRVASATEDAVLDWYGATVELETVVERAADGRLRFWVVDAGGHGSHRSTMRITVNIAPHGGEPMVGGM